MEKNPDHSGGIVDQLWAIFSSMKTGLVLLGLVALSAAAGTLLPQRALYSALWFKLLLGLLGVNLIICTLQRFPRIYRQVFRPPLPVNTTSWKSIRELPGTTAALTAAVDQTFNRDGYVLAGETSENGFRFTAVKRRWGHWGSLLTHLSFILLFAGVLMGSFYGVKGYFMAGATSTVAVRDVPLSKGAFTDENFQIRINSAEERFLPTGELDNWYSDLSIIEDGKEVLRGTIAVNHPLHYQGIVFYQARFADGAKFTVINQEGKSPFVLLENGGNYFQIPGEDLYMLIGNIHGPSAESGIAYQILQDQGKTVQKMGRIKPGETVELANNILIHCDGLAGFTGIQIKKDPGIPLVWLAFALLLAGLFLTFFWRPFIIKGLIKNGHLQIGTTSHKMPGEIGAELDQQISKIQDFLQEADREET